MYPDSPTIRQAVIAEATTWIGTPFHYNNSMVRGAGVACGPLLIAVYGKVGIPVPAISSLGHFPMDWHMNTDEERYLNILLGFTKVVEIPQPGDIALFKIGKVHGHSAIVTEWPRVIHVLWKSVVQHADASLRPLKHRHQIYLSPFE